MSRLIHEPLLAQSFLGGTGDRVLHEACPTSDELWDALDKTQPFSAARYRVLDHCARCPRCAQDLQSTKILLEESQRALEPMLKALGRSSHLTQIEQTPRHLFTRTGSFRVVREHNNTQAESDAAQRRTRPWRRPAALLTLGAAAAALALIVIPKERGMPDTYRGEAAPSARGSQQKAPQGPSAVDGYIYQSGRFAWPATPNGLHYELTIFNDRFDVICRKGAIKTPNLSLSALNCEGLVPAKGFYWRVKTTLKDGSQQSSSYISQPGR